MVDNLEKILPFLKFDSDDDFYYLQILQRKKENPQLGSNSRVIKNYYITSVEQLERRYPEIKEICTLFNARASLRLNRRSFERVGFKALENMANTMQNREYKFLGKSYDRACGLLSNEKEKRWILDLDFVPYVGEHLDIKDFIHDIEPIGDKVLAFIPSKSGMHVITRPFNLMTFKEEFPHIDVHKDNPTNLFIP
jgi:hypothetical protein